MPNGQCTSLLRPGTCWRLCGFRMACSAFCRAARFRWTNAISSCSFFGSFKICFTCAHAARNLHEQSGLLLAVPRCPGAGGVRSTRAPPACAGRAPGPWGCASASPACAPRSAPSPPARAPCLPSQRPDPRPQARSFSEVTNLFNRDWTHPTERSLLDQCYFISLSGSQTAAQAIQARVPCCPPPRPRQRRRPRGSA